jgi:hypothetical protein
MYCVCGNKNSPLFELPGEFEQRNKWLEIIAEFCGNFSKTSTIFIIFYTDISNITDHSVICIYHFEENDYCNTKKSCRLIKGVVPSVFVNIKYGRMKSIKDRYILWKSTLIF